MPFSSIINSWLVHRRVRKLIPLRRVERRLRKAEFIRTEVHRVRDVHVSLLCDGECEPCLYYVWTYSPRMKYVWWQYRCERHSEAIRKAHQLSGSLAAMERT